MIEPTSFPSRIGRTAAAALALALIGGAASAETPKAVFGDWSRGDGLVRARIADCGKSLCMTNTWVRDPDSEEKVGDRVVMNVKTQGENKVAGSGFDPKRKLNLSIELAVAGDTLSTRGCVAGGLICRNVSWSRASR